MTKAYKLPDGFQLTAYENSQDVELSFVTRDLDTDEEIIHYMTVDTHENVRKWAEVFRKAADYLEARSFKHAKKANSRP